MTVTEFIEKARKEADRCINMEPSPATGRMLGQAIDIIERQREALNDIAHAGEYESSQRAIDILNLEV